MNKSEFITVVAQKSGQPKALTADIINAALEAITETVQKKESISIVGFGTLEVKERKARKGYNPRTQEEVEIPASYRPFFKPGSKLKEAANVKKTGKGKKKK